MKISLNWMREFTDIPKKYSAKQLAELLTLRTCEVEGFEDEQVKFANMAVGRVKTLRPHPNADKLRLANTDIGGRTVQIVCGGQNLTRDMLVAVALPGAIVNWHGAGEIVELKEAKVRGEHSFGMICAGEEIGMEASPPQCITDLGKLLKSRGLKEPKPGTPLAQALDLNDIIFEIDNKSLTHRPDLWGHYGIAREFAAFLGKKLRPLKPKIGFPSKGAFVKVDIADKKIANRFLTSIISGIRIAPSPQWLQNRLSAAGLRPVNNIVDITNYVMLEAGYPMHAFDRKVVKNDCFVIRWARAGEKITTIDHDIRSLSPDDAVVADQDHALAIAGVMGGVDCEITNSTTEIILEVGNWNHVMIRKTSQKHSLRSDAAQRFEKSLDPELAETTFRRACEMILQICKGSYLAGPMTDIYINKPKTISVALNAAKAVKKIGAKISEKEMAKHLRALGFSVKGGKSLLKVDVPSWRATKDINIEDDLVEEIARMHGYEKIAASAPVLPVKLPMKNTERSRAHEARKILSNGLGLYEANTYSFYGAPEIKNFLLPAEAHLEIENPLTADQTHLRISLLPNLLKTAAVNIKNRDAFGMYEIGNTYIKRAGNADKSFFPLEERFICTVLLKPESKHEIFYDALGSLETFLEKLHAGKTEVFDCISPPPYSHPKKCASVRVKGQDIGIVYELHPQVLKNLDIDKTCAAFEMNFSRLLSLGEFLPTYRPIPRFPDIEIDISALASEKTSVKEVRELIAHADQNLIADISLVDIFADKSLGQDKKSLTFRIVLRSPERTLNDSEMKTVQENIFKTLTDSGFAIRGL